jgi:hypothetical protein
MIRDRIVHGISRVGLHRGFGTEHPVDPRGIACDPDTRTSRPGSRFEPPPAIHSPDTPPVGKSKPIGGDPKTGRPNEDAKEGEAEWYAEGNPVRLSADSLMEIENARRQRCLSVSVISLIAHWFADNMTVRSRQGLWKDEQTSLSSFASTHLTGR